MNEEKWNKLRKIIEARPKNVERKRDLCDEAGLVRTGAVDETMDIAYKDILEVMDLLER
jgi:hypothetical protein